MARLFNNRPSCIPPLGLRIRKLLPNDFQTTAIYNSNLFGTPPWIVNNFSFLNPFKNLLKSETCSDIFRSIFYSHRHRFSDYLPIYTDGSKSTTAAGCAFVCQNDIVSRRLHPFSSIFTSELTAIYMALEYLSTKQPIKAIIYTDSFSVLQAMIGDNNSHKLVQEIKNLRSNLHRRGFKVLFSWIPAHIGIRGNEQADTAAKSAVVHHSEPLPCADIKSALRNWMLNNWQNDWNLEVDNKLHEIKPIVTQWTLSLNRKYEVISDAKEIANVIGQILSEISSESSYPNDCAFKICEEQKSVDFLLSYAEDYNSTFSYHELKYALRKSNPKSPGPDQIHNNMLKHLGESSLLTILVLFNRIWRERIFPLSWLKAIVVPIPKPGKDKQDPNNYRPIALTSCFIMLLERMVNARLVHVFERSKWFVPSQSGFRRRRNTIDNLLKQETAIRVAFVHKKLLVSIFFDIEKACDRTWRYGILKNLSDID
ncbi:putative RNA-directed DNA polymerase from transposon X-element [Araneus ventricosus]|uniref:Putative RNA-directed DNA polymerase from transposon X-element n=1 Tax=Araneus ventricosus TaxID=182803 RepID=A0A4Y2Q3N1_ARAVE|nr:putative RNA-directed DNA polymerase from transposon X-element [Araneus ventricosus]